MQPQFSPLYLNTVSEYLSAPSLADQQLPASMTSQMTPKDGEKDLSWPSEAYERATNLDDVFERFIQRISGDKQQCVRYDLGGIPLPYQADALYSSLFPAPTSGVSIINPTFTTAHSYAPKRVYDALSIPKCHACGGPRVFECQLMPNLINVLVPAATGIKNQTDEERRAEVMRMLKRQAKNDEKTGMEWGTCLIFSCQTDCCSAEVDESNRECWREEHVLIQWED